MSGHTHAEHGEHAHPHDSQHSHNGGDHHDHGDGDHTHGTGLWAQIKHAITPHSHDHSEVIQTADEARRDGIRVAWIGLAGMLTVAVAQVVIVAVSGSIGLLADTIHSLGHAVTTIPLIIAFKIGGRAATRRYPYGFRRLEDVVGILIALVIFASAIIIIWESVSALIDPRPLTNLGWVFAAGVVGFLGNEIVAIYRIRGGRRIGSAALIAEGHHARTDGFGSLAVAVGIAFAWLGFPQADAIVGLAIAAVILGIMVASLRSILRRLMDSIDPVIVEQVEETLRSVEGVEGLGRVRARWAGHRLSVDAEIVVAPEMTAADVQRVAKAAGERLRTQVRHVEETTFSLTSPEGVAHLG